MIVKEIEKNCENEIIINKSKFIAFSFAIHSRNEIEMILSQIKQKHISATHVCYAYRLLGGEEKCSDAGEPQGTAGKPILDVIKKSGFDNLLIVVVRYFGGIKLGAGGLLRAYSNSASNVLAFSGEKTSTECTKFSFSIPLSFSKYLHQLELIDGIKRFDVRYTENIEISAFVSNDDLSKIKTQMQNILMQNVVFVVDANKYFV